VQGGDKVKVVTVRPTAFDPAATRHNSARIESIASVQDTGQSSFVGADKDAEAPIFGITDYGLEADLFTAVPELVRRLG
jgi:hypothetical protein